MLVVEDDEQLRRLMLAQLATLGYAPLEAGSAAAALDILGSGVRIDVLLTDLVLRDGMDGRRLAAQALELRPTIKILLTSGYPVVAAEADGSPVQVHGVLRKPFRRETLAQSLAGILAEDARS